MFSRSVGRLFCAIKIRDSLLYPIRTGTLNSVRRLAKAWIRITLEKRSFFFFLTFYSTSSLDRPVYDGDKVAAKMTVYSCEPSFTFSFFVLDRVGVGVGSFC